MTRDIGTVRLLALSTNNEAHTKVSNEYPSSKSNYISHLHNALVVRSLAGIVFIIEVTLLLFHKQEN